MEIEEALVTYLKAQTGLAALIGAKIYPDEAPQGTTFPYVTYIDISDIPNHTHDGQDDLENPIKQFTVHAQGKAAAKAIANQIESAMSDYKGTLSGLDVSYITLQNRLASKEKTADVSVNYVDLEFEIVWRRE